MVVRASVRRSRVACPLEFLDDWIHTTDLPADIVTKGKKAGAGDESHQHLVTNPPLELYSFSISASCAVRL